MGNDHEERTDTQHKPPKFPGVQPPSKPPERPPAPKPERR